MCLAQGPQPSDACEAQTRSPISMINTTSERLKSRYFFICRYIGFYEQLKFRAQLSWAWKKFYNLGAWAFTALTFVASTILLWAVNKPDRQQSKTPILSRNEHKKSIETVFSIAICRPTGDKLQSKTLFLLIFDPCSSIDDYIFDCRQPGGVKKHLY